MDSRSAPLKRPPDPLRPSRLPLCMAAVALGSAVTATSASAAGITYGTYSYAADYDTAQQNTGTLGGFNYTNGFQSQTSALATSGPLLSSSASANANLSPSKLSVMLTGDGSGEGTYGTAESWDTLTLQNLPTGPSVNANTVLGTLTLTVTASGGSLDGLAQTNYTLALYNTSQFVQGPNGTTTDCASLTCTGLVGYAQNAQLSVSPTVYSPIPTLGTTTYSVPITLGMLSSGQISFVAEVAGQDHSTVGVNAASLSIDPAVSLTNLYAGVSVQSASGYTAYNSTVPLPASSWMLLSGLFGFSVMARRHRAG